jgi:hypothetical protein
MINVGTSFKILNLTFSANFADLNFAAATSENIKSQRYESRDSINE